MPDELNTDTRYKVEGYGGIAFYTVGYVMVQDEDYEWSGIEYEDKTRARMIMVGDDRVHEIDIEDITPIKDDEYCPECGQIGCKAYAGVFSDI
jgi:hypothetical protein